MASPLKARVFISFDYDHDRDLKTMLVGQSKNSDSPFCIEDWSIKQETSGWKNDARKRARRCDVMIVICGRQTHTATGVGAEIKIAREEGIRFCLLRGRKDGTVRRPPGTSWWDELHPWKWSELKAITAPKQPSWWTKVW